MENINNKRLDYLDVVKGFGIILVVLVHIYAANPNINRGTVVVWIHSFHMPLFFIISGMLLNYRKINDIKKFLVSRIKGILVPYIFFSILSIIVQGIVIGFYKSNIIWGLKVTLIGVGIDTLWFLPALFIAELLFVLINKIIKHNYLKIIIIIIIFIISMYGSIENGLMLLFITRSLIGLGFIAIGYYLFNYINSKNITIWMLIILLIGQVILAKQNNFVDLNNLIFNNKILYIINSILGSIIVIKIFNKIKIINILKYCGLNTLIIMATHLNILYLYRKYIGANLYGYISGLILLFIVMIAEIGLIFLINRYMPCILGKSKIKYNNG